MFLGAQADHPDMACPLHAAAALAGHLVRSPFGSAAARAQLNRPVCSHLRRQQTSAETPPQHPNNGSYGRGGRGAVALLKGINGRDGIWVCQCRTVRAQYDPSNARLIDGHKSRAGRATADSYEQSEHRNVENALVLTLN